MEFDRYAEKYDTSFMGKGSGRFYADLIKVLDVKDGDAVLDERVHRVACNASVGLTVFPDGVGVLDGEHLLAGV